jgi:outer membrane immunogenic protein
MFMRRLSIALIAIGSAIAFTQIASAADMPVKAPLEPVRATTTSWQGFYIGGAFGYGFDVTEMALPGLGVVADTRFAGIGGRGYTAGGLAGYNFMIDPRWLVGVEADGNWQNIETKITLFGLEQKGSMGWSASVRGRIGFLVTPTTMIFASGGWSWSELKLSDNFGPNESFSKSINGPQVGFGVETMFPSGWIMRTEYLQSFYHRVTFDTSTPGTIEASPWVGVARSALIYKFGPQAPVAWADHQIAPIWNGFYAGGMIGVMQGSAKVDTPLAPVTVDGIGFSTVVPSALIGYNFLIAPRWLVGIEGEIVPNISTSDIKVQWAGDARVRGGYLLTPSTLAYGSVGWATAGIKDLKLDGVSIPIERANALTLGTGVEAALSERWHVRADYIYFITNKLDIGLNLAGAGYPGINGIATAHATGQKMRIGLIYQFGSY